MLQFFAVSGFTFPRRSDGGVRIYKEESERGGGGEGKGVRERERTKEVPSVLGLIAKTIDCQQKWTN